MNHRTAKLLVSYCLLLSAFCLLFFSAACMVGPKYHRPTAPAPAAYKETPPATWAETQEWKQAQPSE